MTIENTIAEIEDAVMPWHREWPSSSLLFSSDSIMVEIAQWAGTPDDKGSWQLSTHAVEDLFNRWLALMQGRPMSQDKLPTMGRISAALLVLREWLHHLHFDSLIVLRDAQLLPETQDRFASSVS